jgi:DNA-binding winged helix-turn-helix (wHTH) protein/Tol biopolymer transport system component
MQTTARNRRLRFAQFELDLDARELLRDGRPVRIQPQPLRVLEILAVQAGTLVTREELRQRVWDEATFVEFDQGLNYCIRQIRLALGDDAATPLFIETLKKRGYRFTARVEVVGGGAETGSGDDPDAGKAPPPSFEAASAPSNADPLLRRWPPSRVYLAVAAILVAAVVGIVAVRALRPDRRPVDYVQLTSFTEAAFEPALSPDGRMMAFLVGSDVNFVFSGQVYTMMLPDGEPIRRTHDAFPKYGVAFSPDGSRITYTVIGGGLGWRTMSVPLLGGEPQLLLQNAAGLTWLDQHHALFSEILTGVHMGLVTATDRRESPVRVYVPKHERGMAHYGRASPDRQSVLVVEMDPAGGWARCRLAPMDGHSEGSEVGPHGPCTSAAWSPDGRWMYFTAVVDGASHVWREAFPSGALQQITSGPAQESGMAMSPDGRSLVTSAGILESPAWLHTPHGERPLSADGYASRLRFSRDGRFLFYVLRHAASDVAGKLWQTELSSGKIEPLAQGVPLASYDVSPDGTQIVFAVKPEHGPAEIWLTSRGGADQPRRLTASGEDQPRFGPAGEILFRQSQDRDNYLFVMNADGSKRRQVLRTPITELGSMSPDRRVAFAMAPVNGFPTTAVLAVPVDGGPVRRVCPGTCQVRWSPDGATMYITPLSGERAHKTIAIAVPKGASMPVLPVAGVRSAEDAATIPGSWLVDFALFSALSRENEIVPGQEPGTFAYTRTISHRNLFRVQLP